ncbi:MAG TPA: aldehyde dehydrogenase family protein, partial [Variovorax sp.]|nr:aldehyde dehydrogenase family protein [Variovorax sp.]
MMNDELSQVFQRAGIGERHGGSLRVRSPIDGTELACLHEVPAASIDEMVNQAQAAFRAWRQVPAPVRGELVRLWGEELRAAKADIGHIVSLEAGKITQEGLGEAQECVDICDFALGLSRQLYGRTIVSERPGHRMMEQYHPLGPVAVI